MQFTKLRLSGFKSFVEPTEFVIHPGLTGIVGPNGCGKSNLVEALRWVMGENSAKRMRGSGMDDMIFAGTATRPARNVAEVALFLDNKSRTAPAAFNEHEQLEIARRIERERGSDYRINGQDVRARDVQLFFADLASGAHSPAMVSQGRVGALINAKPTDRRMLLEEAAGISGLHSRRHEAELRLKAAETNLERVVDVIGQLDMQLQGLKRQARQASRYRNIAGQIRRTEAMLFHLKHQALMEALAAAEAALNAAERGVADRTLQVSEAQAAERIAADALPPLRQHEAEAGARLHRLAVARDSLDAEEARAQAAAQQTEQRLIQIAGDRAREATLAEEAEAALLRLQGEADALKTEQDAAPEAEAAAEAAVSAAAADVAAREQELDAANRRAAEDAAERQRIAQAIAEAERRLERLNARLAEIAAETARLEAEAGNAEAAQASAEIEAAAAAVEAARLALDETERAQAALVEAARAALDGVEAEHAAQIETARAGLAAADSEHGESIAAARAAMDAADAERARLQAVEQQAREAWQAAQAEVTRLKAEEAGLARLLKADERDLFAPVIDQVTVAPGFEKALGAALGDELDCATDSGAPLHWEALPPLSDAPTLPAGAEPLSSHVQAPAALARRLSQIGVVDEADGARLRGELKAGQRLVSRTGALWRWDGFTIKTGAPTAASLKLEQRNRLADLREELREREAKLPDAQAAFAAAREALEQAAQAERMARNAVQAAEQARETARSIAAAALAEAEKARAAARERAGQALNATERDRQAARERGNQDVLRADRALEAARAAQAEVVRREAERQSRLAALAEQAGQARTDAVELEQSRAALTAQAAALPPADDLAARIATLRGELEGLRQMLAERRAALEGLHREAEARSRRLQAIADEQASAEARRASAAQQAAALDARRAEAEAELAEYNSVPARLAEKRALLLSEIAMAEAARREAADHLANAEAAQSLAARTAREAEGLLGEAREARVKADADLAHQRESGDALAARIREVLDCAPEDVLKAGEVEEDEEFPALPQVENRLERLRKERDNMGPVNLRAEIEAQEVEEKLTALQTEQTDLVAAIEKLRQGIGTLNKEGRERLLEAFKKVDAHFQTLFTRVFGGGRAHLQLVESEDPLEAGLEIYASPPGKRLQVMSLLSGGEQALTALSLLFAVFLTNPAPICVLDEVDAPLDDANVERLCNLMEEMAKQTAEMGEGTRFVVVTHHPITMARMDRLFGVTMAERGVSTLVSVDLASAEAMATAAE